MRDLHPRSIVKRTPTNQHTEWIEANGLRSVCTSARVWGQTRDQRIVRLHQTWPVIQSISHFLFCLPNVWHQWYANVVYIPGQFRLLVSGLWLIAQAVYSYSVWDRIIIDMIWYFISYNHMLSNINNILLEYLAIIKKYLQILRQHLRSQALLQLLRGFVFDCI